MRAVSRVFAAELMAVGADDDPIRLTARPDPSEIVVNVALVGPGRNRKAFVYHIAIPRQDELRCFIVGNFLVAIEMLARSFLIHLETELKAHAL